MSRSDRTGEPSPAPAGPAWPDGGSAPCWSGDSGELPPAPEGGAGLRYQRATVLGVGGMGRVWAAEDRALRREVALKEVRPGLADPASAAARLRREAWITARLDHPGVIAVHDIGEDAHGEPFYTMRLVRGRSLASALQACPDLDARLGLLRALLAATEAVAAAHALGLVHRDLKPDNILIGGLGETQVVDWGLAAPAGPHAARWAAEGLPPAGPGVVGTPGWMAPEQARGEPAGPPSDVWALGAVLHALLAGGPPAEAPTPPDAPPELLAVAARAMDPDPARRYPDAAALAEDLDRYFRGLRVRAHAYSSTELLRRFLAAWRVPIRVGLIGLIAVIGALLLGLRAAQTERTRAVEAEVAARGALGRAEAATRRLLSERAVEAAVADARARAEALAAESLAYGEDPDARGVLAAFSRAGRPSALDLGPAPPCPEGRLSPGGDLLVCPSLQALIAYGGFAENRLVERWRADAAGMRPWPLIEGQPVRLASGTAGRVELHDPRSGAWQAAYTAEDPLAFAGGQFGFVGPGGMWSMPREGGPCTLVLAAAERPGDGALAAMCADGRLVLAGPSARPRSLATPVHGEHEASVLAWGTDRDTLLIGTLRGSLHRIDLRTGAVGPALASGLGRLQSLVLGPGGGLAAVAGDGAGVGLWDLERHAWLGTLPARPGAHIAFLPGGDLLVVDDRVRRWTLREGMPYQMSFAEGLSDVALSPDGASVAVAGGTGLVAVRRMSDGSAVRTESVARLVVKAVEFAADGETLLVALLDRPWLLALPVRGGDARPSPHPLRGRRVVQMLDRRLIVALGELDPVELAPDGRELRPLDGVGELVDLERDADRRQAWALNRDGGVYALRPSPRRLAEHPTGRAVAPAPGGGGAVALDDAVLLLDDAGQERRRLPAPGAGLREVVFSPDGARVLAAGMDARVWVWRVADGELLARIPGHRERIAALAVSGDGATVVSASWDRTVRLADLRALDAPREALRAAVAEAWAAGVGAPAGVP